MSKLSLRKKNDPKANKKITGFFRKEDKDELVDNETTVKSKSVLGNISNLPVKQNKFVVQSPEIIKLFYNCMKNKYTNKKWSVKK